MIPCITLSMVKPLVSEPVVVDGVADVGPVMSIPHPATLSPTRSRWQEGSSPEKVAPFAQPSPMFLRLNPKTMAVDAGEQPSPNRPISAVILSRGSERPPPKTNEGKLQEVLRHLTWAANRPDARVVSHAPSSLSRRTCGKLRIHKMNCVSTRSCGLRATWRLTVSYQQ